MEEPEYAIVADGLKALETALEHAWTADTSVDPANWSEDNPAYGQCAATACVVQDYLGGDIVNSYVEVPDHEDAVSHYFNDVNGVSIDFTAQQFSDEATIPRGTPKPKEFDTTREYVLSYDATRERYETLKEQVDQQL